VEGAGVLSPSVDLGHAGNVSFVYIFTSPVGAVAKYCDEYVCLSVCLSARISPEPHA